MSFEDSFKILNTETEKLESAINTALAKSQLTIPEIVQTYYRIMNVTSLCTILKQQHDDDGDLNEYSSLAKKIEEIQELISKKFDLDLHPTIMMQLEHSLADTTKKLQSGNALEKSANEIESESKLFEKLRQTMSTKEFVEQYGKGLSYD